MNLLNFPPAIDLTTEPPPFENALNLAFTPTEHASMPVVPAPAVLPAQMPVQPPTPLQPAATPMPTPMSFLSHGPHASFKRSMDEIGGHPV